MKLGLKVHLLVCLGAGLLLACTHLQPAAASGEPYRFPPRFFVEQGLEITTPEATHSLLAQLERQDQALLLVLTDRLTGIVLARVALPEGQAPQLQFLSPHVPLAQLPVAEIGAAVQFLYAAPAVAPVDGVYTLADQAGRWTYRWQQLKTTGACAFPALIDLRFKDSRYAIQISLRQLDCT